MITPPLGLYIHIPWCIQKCPYCDFNSHQAGNLNTNGTLSRYDAYVDALVADLEADLPLIWGRRIETIFIGGGTPSLMPGKSMQRLFAALRSRLNILPNAEITLEANPGTVDENHFADYFESGINRLSIGGQSFSHAQLKKLGRIHGPRQIQKTVEVAKRVGFERINIDIMFGLPDQTEREALDDLQQAIDLCTEHVSWYQLTIEPNTVFYKTKPPVPDNDHLASMHEAGIDLLTRHHFQQYEVSAFAKQHVIKSDAVKTETIKSSAVKNTELPNTVCKHNVGYWQFGDYLGIGAGSHSKITGFNPEKNQFEVTRRHKHRQPTTYMQDAEKRLAGEKVLSRDELIFESLMNALRLKNGMPFKTLLAHSLLSEKDILEALSSATDLDLIDQPSLKAGTLKTTQLGYLHLDGLLSQLTP